MTEIINNVDLAKVSQTAQKGREDKESLRKPVKLEGEWILDQSQGFQFKTELGYEKGKQIIEVDSPSFLGGQGNKLGPMAYCIAGITSCFVGTFVGIAAQQKIKLTKLKVKTQCQVNFAKTFDISDEPITEGINFQVEAEGENTDKAKLQELLVMAEERCPAMYSMSHKINVDAKIV